MPLVNEVADIRNHIVGRIARRDQQRRRASHLVNNGVIPAVPTAFDDRLSPAFPLGAESGCYRGAAQSIVIDPDRRLTSF